MTQYCRKGIMEDIDGKKRGSMKMPDQSKRPRYSDMARDDEPNKHSGISVLEEGEIYDSSSDGESNAASGDCVVRKIEESDANRKKFFYPGPAFTGAEWCSSDCAMWRKQYETLMAQMIAETARHQACQRECEDLRARQRELEEILSRSQEDKAEMFNDQKTIDVSNYTIRQKLEQFSSNMESGDRDGRNAGPDKTTWKDATFPMMAPEFNPLVPPPPMPSSLTMAYRMEQAALMGRRTNGRPPLLPDPDRETSTRNRRSRWDK